MSPTDHAGIFGLYQSIVAFTRRAHTGCKQPVVEIKSGIKKTYNAINYVCPQTCKHFFTCIHFNLQWLFIADSLHRKFVLVWGRALSLGIDKSKSLIHNKNIINMTRKHRKSRYGPCCSHLTWQRGNFLKGTNTQHSAHMGQYISN